MPNCELTDNERELANHLLVEVIERLKELSANDKSLDLNIHN